MSSKIDSDFWSNTFTGLFAFVLFMLASGIVGLVFAWPLKWTWNYVMPYLFGLKMISWGQAWCLSWVAATLIKGSHYGK